MSNMMSCKEICAHQAGSQQADLGWRLRLELSLHLMMCGNCRMAAKQFRLMLSTTPRRQAEAPSEAQIKHWMIGVERALENSKEHKSN
ncbi:MAG: hypothetical protein KBT61_06500 [Paraperlucidibaca sp.]|jgi:hypothetical protein|nr:hypothetical protein [Paraperlucidibaca sp.]MBQ0842600.1 hypothetical protein [Paraperlucidibaca sp.]|tara:strand:+ start:3281 stop:3544 length:264 start_codon:yes stop_codon:yes gene_type:complete